MTRKKTNLLIETQLKLIVDNYVFKCHKTLNVTLFINLFDTKANKTIY